MLYTVLLIVISTTIASAQIVYNSTANQYICPTDNLDGDFCAGDSLSTNIIIRCSNGVGQLGNCDDNLAESFPEGDSYSPCWQTNSTAGDAACSKNCIVNCNTGGCGADLFSLPNCTPSATASSTPSTSINIVTSTIIPRGGSTTTTIATSTLIPPGSSNPSSEPTQASSGVTTSTTSNANSTTQSPSTQERSGLSSGTKAGIGVGVTLGLLLFAGFGALTYCYGKRSAAKGKRYDGPAMTEKAELGDTSVPLSAEEKAELDRRRRAAELEGIPVVVELAARSEREELEALRERGSAPVEIG